MAKLNPRDTWNPNVLSTHPMFWPLLPAAESFLNGFQTWPGLQDFQNYLNKSDNPVQTRSGHHLTVVPQATAASHFEDSYEPRIYLKGELQTREQSWHDLFQILIWRLFPETKAAVNELHYKALASRRNSDNPNRRNPLENTLTQYDECGGIIVSSDAELLELIKNFDWHTLFWKNRPRIEKSLKCIVFGHAIYEKAISPYIGMTTHNVLLTVTQNLIDGPIEELIAFIDSNLQNQFSENSPFQTPQDLAPIFSRRQKSEELVPCFKFVLTYNLMKCDRHHSPLVRKRF